MRWGRPHGLFAFFLSMFDLLFLQVCSAMLAKVLRKVKSFVR